MFSWVRNQLSFLVVLGAVFFFIVFLAVFWLLLYLFQPEKNMQGNATAVFTIIPPSLVTEEPQIDLGVTPTAQVTDPEQQEISAGSYVEVYDTGSSGLRIRSGAGINNFVQFIAFDEELYEVQAGPQEADGYTWWFIVSAYDQNRSGWAVDNYLRIIQAQ